MTPEERQRTVDRLAARLAAVQRNLPPEQASDIARRAAGDDEVLEVAARWLESGAWPSKPERERWTPSDLARLHRPSYVLTALLWLKQDPDAARDALKHTVADPEVDYHPQVTDDPIAAGFFARKKKESSGDA